MKYKSRNGYFKFYNKNGLSCRIKIQDEISGKFIIKYKGPDEIIWNYISPDFSAITIEVINYILKNLETDNSVFKIVPARSIIQPTL
jgi:hypothetical protein